MAKTPTDDAPKKKRGTSVLVWVLLAMMIGSLGSFGVTNFGGNIAKIGTVGKRDVKVSDYAREINAQLGNISQQFGQQISFTQANAFGLAVDQSALQAVLARAALDNETDKIGISAGAEVVAAKLGSIQAFQGLSGAFDRETYKLALQQTNQTAGEFESGLRSDIARSLLQGAVMGGFVAPEVLTSTIFNWAAEKRGYSLLHLTEADLPSPLTEATDADLKAYYDTHIEAFTKAEAKRLTYAVLLPEDLAATTVIEDQAVKDLYQTRIGTYVVPEKRLVERLVFGTEDEAKAAKARLDAGTPFETLVTERGLALADIDLGDVSRADLGAAGDAVFALTGPGVVGPLLSNLGPALFRMNAVLAAQETSFDSVKAALTLELQLDAARKLISDKVEPVDDLLAGGATLEDLAKEQGLTLAQTDYILGDADNAAIAADPDFAKAADAAVQGDFPAAVLMKSGGLFALRLDEVVPPTPVPFDLAKAKVGAAWRADALSLLLGNQAILVKSGVEAGASLGKFGIVSVTNATTRDASPPDVPASLLPSVFKLAVGDVQVIEAGDFVGVVRLDTITPADPQGTDATAMRDAIASQTQKGMAQDALSLFTSTLTTSAGITLDQSAIAAVHANFN